VANLEDIVKRGNELFNAHDVKGLTGLYASNAKMYGPGDMVMNGPGEIARFTEGWIQGFPDCAIRPINHFVVGNVVIEEGVFTGTHTGVFPTPMGDIPATGRRVEGPFVDIFEFDGDKIVSDRLTFDRLRLMEQLGLMPTPAGAGASA
jgi:hypothetical protein